MGLVAWKIESSGGSPTRLAAGVVELERNLEDWIQNDPSLIDPGLLVVRRQMHVEGGILDLLCIDLQGRLTVIEIKRGRLIRETIAQAIDYASSIASMPHDALIEQVRRDLPSGAHDHPGLAALSGDTEAEREITAIVVGVGREPGLERMIDFLGSSSSFPIRAVTFDVFEAGDGVKILVREEIEAEAPAAGTGATTSSIASVVEAAGGSDSPNGRRLLRIARVAEEAGLYVRPFKWSLMFTPMAKKTRHLITIWKWADADGLALEYSSAAFAEFFPIEAERVSEVIGLQPGRHSIRSDADADAWAERIERVFRVINQSPDDAEALPSLHTMGTE